MSLENRRHIARMLHNLYLYPYRSRAENIIRGLSWMASWIVGIVLQPSTPSPLLGGAYFIFSLSLLLEFYSEVRQVWYASIIHNLFCFLLAIILLGSLAMSFGSSEVTSSPIALCLIKSLPINGWIVSAMIFLRTILPFFEVDTLFFNELLEQKEQEENDQKNKRKLFVDKLNGRS